MQCIFDPKKAKMAKTSIFPDTTLPFDDSKQLSPVSDEDLDKSDERLRRKCPKTSFSSKMAKFWTKKGSKNCPDFLSEQKFSLTIFKQ